MRSRLIVCDIRAIIFDLCTIVIGFSVLPPNGRPRTVTVIPERGLSKKPTGGGGGGVNFFANTAVDIRLSTRRGNKQGAGSRGERYLHEWIMETCFPISTIAPRNTFTKSAARRSFRITYCQIDIAPFAPLSRIKFIQNLIQTLLEYLISLAIVTEPGGPGATSMYKYFSAIDTASVSLQSPASSQRAGQGWEPQGANSIYIYMVFVWKGC